MNIAIVGAGITGLACATFLARLGVRIQVFEQAATPGPVGAGLLLQPVGLHVLDELGVLPLILKHGAPVAQLYGSDQGRMILDLQYHRAHPAAFGVGIHRGVLWRILYDLALQSGVEIIADAKVVDCQQTQDQATLMFDKHPNAAFDGVIIASGTFTPLREALGLKHRIHEFSWGAIWSIVSNPQKLFYQHPQLKGGVLRQWYKGASKMLGVMPVGQTALSESGQATQPAVTLFWSLPLTAQQSWFDHFAQHRADMLSLAPELEPLLSDLSAQDCAFARYADVRACTPHQHRVMVLGDSAHATSPQLGQGANLGLLDAYSLQQAWLKYANSDLNIPKIWHQTISKRRVHWRYVQQASRFLTPFFQSSSGIAGWLRNATLPIACKLSITQKDMVRTLTGVKAGWLCQKPLNFPYLSSLLEEKKFK